MVISFHGTLTVYIENGQKVEVSGEDLFESSWLVDVDGLGTFETYPNRDSTNYIKDYDLEGIPDFYKGLFRHPGYCNSISVNAAGFQYPAVTSSTTEVMALDMPKALAPTPMAKNSLLY